LNSELPPLHPASIPSAYLGIPTKTGEAASLYNAGAIKFMVGIEAGQTPSLIKEGRR